MSDDWEYGDNGCPKCHNEMAWRRCGQCEDGLIEDDDGINGRSYDRCDTCNGTGHEEWCRECGWDNVYKQFLSPKCEAEWLAKQEEEKARQA
jgi:predicted RNA-binding Zn-ribbon protein involved in translation (DUF1610 family)